MTVTLIALGWIATGAVGGHLLSYAGDGFNHRHVFGAMVGPISLLIAAIDRLE